MLILLSRESDPSAVTSSLRSCRQSGYHTKRGESRSVLFPTVQQINLSACSSHCPFNAAASSREAVNTNFAVVGLTRLGIKPESTAPESHDLTARPPALLRVLNKLIQDGKRLLKRAQYRIQIILTHNRYFHVLEVKNLRNFCVTVYFLYLDHFGLLLFVTLIETFSRFLVIFSTLCHQT